MLPLLGLLGDHLLGVWQPMKQEAPCRISYYGGELPSLASRMAACPFMAHFGIHDGSIPEKSPRICFNSANG